MATDHVTSGDARKELQAALGARRDLGEEYENEVLDSFVEKMDARIAERVDQALAVRSQQQAAQQYYPSQPPQPAQPAKQKGDSASTWVAIASLGCGIPITAVAASESGIIGMMVAWAGIATINLAHAVSRAGRS
ncbi:MAG TPA: hypothetical protein VFB74_25620 [Kribbellaceae bacterium]|nr:hypothetical protein [Kribbellaceae bacterium]